MLKFLIFLAVCCFAVPSHAQEAGGAKPGTIYSSTESISTSMQAVPCDGIERLRGVKKLFRDAGAAEQDIDIQTFDNGEIKNLIVRKKGSSAETIVVGAHYDHVGGGCGATDNWSGIVIIAHLFKTIRPLQTNKSYIFAAFDKEEEGLVGSKKMVKNMPQQELEQICSMVNFDSFGQGYPMALRNASSDEMIELAEKVGKEGGIKFVTADIEQASSDSKSFLNKKIPAITLSGLTNEWTTILHSGNDKIGKVRMDSVVIGYRFGLNYLAKLDNLGCRGQK